MNLLVSDFDGTFYDDNYFLNIKFVNNIKKNTDFVIATGRNFNYLLKDLQTTCKYYICNDGGYILDDENNIIYSNIIEDKTVNLIYNRILDVGYNEFYFDDIKNLNKIPKKNINKILIKINNCNDYDKMKKILNELSDVYGYISNNWINIVSINSSKSNAISFILKNTNYSNIYTVGNDINDFDMIQKFNGYLISEKNIENYNTINNFLELKNIIK